MPPWMTSAQPWNSRGSASLGFGRHLGFPVGNRDLQPPGIVLAADKAVIIGDGHSHEILRSLRSLRMTGEGTFAAVST